MSSRKRKHPKRENTGSAGIRAEEETILPAKELSESADETRPEEIPGDNTQNLDLTNPETGSVESAEDLAKPETEQAEPAEDLAEPETEQAEPAEDPTEPETEQAEPAEDPTVEAEAFPEAGTADAPDFIEDTANQDPAQAETVIPDGDQIVETETDSEANEPENGVLHWWSPQNGKVTWVIYLAALVGIMTICGIVFYFQARKEPAEALADYMNHIKALDFEGMNELLLDGDLSALETADLNHPAYHDFFSDVNARLEYEVVKEQLNILDGTASIAAHIRYVDATQLYEAVLSEFLRGVVSSAFAGEALPAEENEEILSRLLLEKREELPEQYAETEVLYPLTNTAEGWKIDVLDEQTIKVMSANFKSIEEEISKVLYPPEEDEQIQVSDQDAAAERSVVNLSGSDSLNVQTDTFRLQFYNYTVALDYAGNDCLLYYYTYTNLNDAPSSAMVDVRLQAFQDGKTLEEAIPNDQDPALSSRFAEIASGESCLVCEAFELPKRENVSIQTHDQDGNVLSQVLRIPQ